MAVTVSFFFTELHIVTEVHWFLFSKLNHQMPAFISPFLVVIGVRKEESGDDLKVMGVFHSLPTARVCGLLSRFFLKCFDHYA